MSDPVALMLAIDADAGRLDELEQALGDATDLLDQAEDAWLEHRDGVAESLKDEMNEQGRKGDPAEHWIDTQARRENRVAWSNHRRAERAVRRIKEQLKAKQAAMNGRQSQLGALREELRARPYQPQPQGQTYGARRAA